MPVCIGAVASGVFVAPSVTVSSSTNFNQNSGVLNATVVSTGNRGVTSVEFQWSTSSTFASGNSAWTAASTNTAISQGSANTARSVTATGLSSGGTTYYVRARATNASGFVTTSAGGGSFATYRLLTENFTGSRTWTNPVPTSGTSGLAITEVINLTVVGGGGGASFFASSGAGGGGVTTASSLSVGSSVTVVIGAGGAIDGAGYDPTFGFPLPTSGSASSIIASTTLSANGGGLPTTGDPGRGGTSGNGNLGGFAYDAGGGGGGAGGAGSDGGSSVGGAGGAALLGYGGGGGGTEPGSSVPSDQGSPRGNGPANSGRGAAGSRGFESVPTDSGQNGGSGFAQFQYWGP